MEERSPSTHLLTVLIPARNEAANLDGCVQSLIAQSEPGFLLGEHWHLLLIDDNSEDQTPAVATALAATHPGIHMLSAPPLNLRPHGFTGKNAALWFGAAHPLAQTAEWLLFTDADTLDEPGSTHRATVEAGRHGLHLLSYSPRQIASGPVQQALLPLIFSELATTYPPKKVSDPSSPVAAANGQFLLTRRDTYFALGGHGAVSDRVVEDVALARIFKRRHPIRLRYAPEAVAARMYRTTPELIEGWTKNLALLFGRPLLLALSRTLDLLLLFGLPTLLFVMHLFFWQQAAIVLLWLRVVLRYFTRVSRSGASIASVLLSLLALPLFTWLLIRSWQQVSVRKSITWKGRAYEP